jgi:hypothetical protein
VVLVVIQAEQAEHHLLVQPFQQQVERAALLLLKAFKDQEQYHQDQI